MQNEPQVEPHGALWLDRSQTVSIAELVDLSGLSEREVCELVEFGVLAPINPQEIQWTFSADCAVVVRKAGRLRDDLELDAHAMALALALLEQIRGLEAELSRLRAQQPSSTHR